MPDLPDRDATERDAPASPIRTPQTTDYEREARLRSTTDAMVWADEFCRTFSVFADDGVVQDKVGLMLTWFANAIEIGRDAGREADTPDTEPLCRGCDKPIQTWWVHFATGNPRCHPQIPYDHTLATPKAPLA